ncbi:MAG: amidohydrolase family protein [Phycisphaeraceae bacterium]|nr:amidohydrolase family protein [Phycisphaeraceae bacterium]
MIARHHRRARGRVAGFITAASLLIACAVPASAQIAVVGETVYTMAGAPIRDGVVVIRDGRIAAVGPAASTPVPPGFRVHRARVVTPGLVDARATVGLTGIYNVPHDQDQAERSSAMQPELRAVDAYNALERLVTWVRGFGVTTIHTGHAPGELITGQTMIVKTVGRTVDDAMVRETAAIVATLGPGGQRREGSPGTRGKAMAMLRQELIRAGEYAHRRDDAVEDPAAPDAAPAPEAMEAGPGRDRAGRGRDLRLEALARVLSGELPLLVTANHAQDIASALRLQQEFGIRIWLDGAAEAALLLPEIRAADVPVILHPAMARMVGEYENASFETPLRLHEAGIAFAMQSGFEGYVPKVRVVLFEAAIAAGYGLGPERALAMITIDAARILGIDDRLGSIAPGKDADLALYDGDPFEYTTKCTGVIIDGAWVDDGR